MMRTQTARHLVHRHTISAMAHAKLKKWQNTRRGKSTLAGARLGRVINELKPMGEDKTLDGNNFMMLHRQLMVEGNATRESLELLYAWMGNVMTAMLMRKQRGNKTMQVGIRAMFEGRQALRKQTNMEDFETAFDLGIAFIPSLSEWELREVFKLAAKHDKARKGMK